MADRDNNRIQKFDGDGTFLTAWGTSGTGDGEFEAPFAVAVASSGDLYVADRENNRVQQLDGNGDFVRKWGILGSGDGEFVQPYSIAVDTSGNVYVADTHNNRIQKFTGNGVFVTKWGSTGAGDGQFQDPYGIAVDGSGNVYVADGINNRIQKFTSDGNFVAQWGVPGTGDGEFSVPWGVAVDASGNVYVADLLNHRIQKFTGAGEFLTSWGLTDPVMASSRIPLAWPSTAPGAASSPTWATSGSSVSRLRNQTVTATTSRMRVTTAPPDPNSDQANSDGDAQGDACDPCPSDATNTCNDADISVTKAGPATATVGSNFDYTVTVSNAGPSAATGVKVTDTLPSSNVTFVSAAASQGTCSESLGDVVCSLGSLADGASATVTITVAAAVAGTAKNDVSVEADQADPETSDNADSVTTSIGAAPVADLSLSKDDGVSSVTAGGSVTYTIAATNAGPDTVTGATVEDMLPAALTGVTWTCVGTDGGTCTGAGAGNINDTVNLPPTGSVTYTVNATVSPSASGSLSNTATIVPPAGTLDPDPADATDSDTDTIGSGDSDGDGLSDAKENSIGTDPQDPDTDDDGLRDGAELASSFACLSPLRKDSDGDLLGDGYERKGVIVGLIYTTNSGRPGTKYYVGRVKTNPCKRDSDADGLTDYREAAGSIINQRVIRSARDGGPYWLGTRKTHPMKRDTDGDSLSDKLEITGNANWRFDRRRSDPTRADTDWGGNKDGAEVFSHHSDPTRVGT